MPELTFKMPFLSKYTFDAEGNCYSKENMLTIQGYDRYKLKQDNDKFCWVSKSEIIAYCNHLLQVKWNEGQYLYPVIFRPIIKRLTNT